MMRSLHTLSYAMIALSPAVLAAAHVTVDPLQSNSILLENFSASNDPSFELRNGISFQSSAGGVATYSLTGELDPQLIFKGYVEGIDFSSYPNVRVRHAFSQPVEHGSVFPIPVRPGQFSELGINETLAGRQVTLTQHEGRGNGLRLDPVDGAPAAGEYSIDYIIVDRGRTLGFEFDAVDSTRGGLNNFFNGNNLGGINGKEIISGVSDGLYRGKPTSADPMMILQLAPATGLDAINTEVYRFVEIRMRVPVPQGGAATVYYRTDAVGGAVHGIEFDLVDDKYFHTYLIDLREDPAWTGGRVTSFRLDPTNKAQDFEIDHIRFYETAAGSTKE